MPDGPLAPERRTIEVQPGSISPPSRQPFVELGLASCFSFLRGASEPVDLVETAWELGYDALGIADANSMAGVVRIHVEASKLLIKPVIGCRIETVEGLAFLAYPKNRDAYARLCRLISAGRTRTLQNEWQEKGVCEISLTMLANHAEDVQLILLPPADLAREFTIEVFGNVMGFSGGLSTGTSMLRAPFAELVPHLSAQLPTLRHIAAAYLYMGDDVARIQQLDALANRSELSLFATNHVLYNIPERRPLQDVMTAIREKTTVAKAGFLLQPNAERHLKSSQEMVKLFARWPHAIAATREVADACCFNLQELGYEYPEERYPDGLDAQQYLEKLCWEGAQDRYPQGAPELVREGLAKEFGLIATQQIAPYFLTIRNIVHFARTRKPPILCQGRGSAANSVVCFCLGITAVDPTKNRLLFDRFLSSDRSEPPDIDVDFEHERREEVIQHIYDEYGRDHAGLCATVIHYRPRMAIREVGKAMGLTEDVTAALARTVWGGHGRTMGEKNVAETGLDINDPYLKRVLKLTEQMIGMPRHLSQHVGGFILTERPLIDTVPIGNGAMPKRSFIEWDKNDIEALGIFKVDILALGMLTCIRKCLNLLEQHYGLSQAMHTIPQGDPEVYDMLCKGDSLGVFQVESRAQMNMLPRLRPRVLYDLVVQVAIVRPGPIQGDMVHPYLKRRRGAEPVRIPSPAPDQGPPDELSNILQRTYGVPIFQEQAMQIALDAAKFTSAEANELRKAMATFRAAGTLWTLEERMVTKMVARGYDPEFSQRCFNQIKGFGEYGFPESHAASFAHLVYVSSWIKCHYPAAFACGLLNSQPMGFYAPAQIVRDAREHGVIVLPADINHSVWDCELEDVHRGDTSRSVKALRLGFRQIDGLSKQTAKAIDDARQKAGPFADVVALHERTQLHPGQIEQLAAADAFGSLGLSRRQALWDARTLIRAPELPLFAAAHARDQGAERVATRLPLMPLSEEVVADYQTHRLSLKAHPLAFLRAPLADRGFMKAADLINHDSPKPVLVAGVVLVRQRPGSAKNVVFITIEDETGVANIVIWPHLMEKYRKVIMGARLLEVRGCVEQSDGVVHLIAAQLADATPMLDLLSEDTLAPQLARADHVNRPLQGSRGHPRNVRVIPKSRDFH
jgi:error-prone DNA polymerase